MVRWLGVGFCLCCWGCAALQYNDPDPWLWGSYYFAIGLFVALTLAGWRLRLGFIALVIASVALMISSWPGVVQYWNNQDGQTLSHAMSREFPYLEMTREFGGALGGLLITGMAFACRPHRRMSPESNSPAENSKRESNS